MNEIHNRLSAMIDRNRLHHAFFFVGSGQKTHEAKMQSIEFLASNVFAKSSEQPLEKLVERIQNRYHPDFFQIDIDDAEIKLDQVQELIGWIYKAPMEGEQKFAVIEHAQRLNQSASNALLKTLEEPPAHATLILCAPSKDHILQTLRSRMSVIQFPQSQEQGYKYSEAPAWFEKIQVMIAQEKFIEKEVFELTQEMGKNRADLVYFFAWIQDHLKERMQKAPASFDFHLYSDLFDKTLLLENQIYKRYGNISLQLDHFFMDWKQRVH